MPLRAAVVHRSCGNGAELLDHDGHDGTAALAGPPAPSPARRCPLLALRGSHIARDGHCGWLQAADRSRSRCRLPPCRPAWRRSSIKSCRWSVGSCHGRSDKAALSLLAAAHEQRPRATLPFAMTPPHAAQRQPLPPFTMMRAHGELMNLSLAVERIVRQVKCPCHAQSHSHDNCARTTKCKQLDRDCVHRPEPCRPCLRSVSSRMPDLAGSKANAPPAGTTAATPSLRFAPCPHLVAGCRGVLLRNFSNMHRVD